MHQTEQNRDREGAANASAVPYFAMEYVPGAKTITQYAQDKNLATRDALRLFAQACDAVHHGHQKGIIHRDLKPGNILVDSAGEPKVIDFGVARATDSDLAITTQQTVIGQLIGTMQYMSPEQCDADPHDLDTRSDVYSLGVVLYELLTGEVPYDLTRTPIPTAARIICEKSPPRPSVLNRKLRGDLEMITLKALEKDRQKRYQSAADLAQDIRRHLAGEPIEARAHTAWTRAVRWVGRHPVVTTNALSLTMGGFIIAGTLISVWAFNRRPHRIINSGDKHEARMLSFAGGVLHKWTAEPPGEIRFAKLVERPPELGGGQFALLGFNNAYEYDYPHSLCAFHASGDLAKPLWQGRIEIGEALPDPHERGHVAEQFDIQMGKAIDVFRERPGKEVVAVHLVRMYSQCFIRIYDLSGEVLYQVWHDGVLVDCCWMSQAGLLVFIGDNAEVPWQERGYNGEVRDPHPRVVFAVRPKLGDIHSDFLRSTLGDDPDDPLRPAWYGCLFPENVADLMDDWSLRASGLSKAGQSVHISVQVNKELRASVGWDIDESGREIPGSRVLSDNYNRNQKLRDGDPAKLPDPKIFKLGPLPPVQSPSDDTDESSHPGNNTP